MQLSDILGVCIDLTKFQPMPRWRGIIAFLRCGLPGGWKRRRAPAFASSIRSAAAVGFAPTSRADCVTWISQHDQGQRPVVTFSDPCLSVKMSLRFFRGGRKRQEPTDGRNRGLKVSKDARWRHSVSTPAQTTPADPRPSGPEQESTVSQAQDLASFAADQLPAGHGGIEGVAFTPLGRSWENSRHIHRD